MGVKYWFRFHGEKLFGVTYVFQSETIAKAVEQGLLLHLGTGVEKVLSFESKVVPYQPEHLLEWLERTPAFAQLHHKLKVALPPAQTAKPETVLPRVPAPQVRNKGVPTAPKPSSGTPSVSQQMGRKPLEPIRTPVPSSSKPASAAPVKPESTGTPPATLVQKPTGFRQEPKDGPSESSRKQHIQQIVREKRIQQLVHFTRLENLASILQEGLMSRQALETNCQKMYFHNDADRWEGHMNALCLSISFPNYRMFYAYRSKPENQGVRWVVLCLDPALLWELSCGFTPKNAASRDMWDHDRQRIHQPDQLLKMFGDGTHHQENGLPLHFTEDPQAEVLVFDPIPPKYITEIHFQEFSNVTSCRTGDGRLLHPITNSRLFGPRQDHVKWSSVKGML